MVAQDMKAIHDSEHTLVMGVLNITEDTWWPTTPKACTSYSIGAVGWPERPAMCLTPTPPCMRTGC